MMEDSALWLATRSGMAADGRVGVIGISFAGGLAVAAAGRPVLRDRVAFVLSVSGHGDLVRTLRYLCTGVLADGTRLLPHDYGVAIALLAVADRVVPADQVEGLRSGIVTFLEASRVDPRDSPRADATFDRALRREGDLPEPAAGLMRLVNRRAVDALGPLLLPHVGALAADPALSPERSPSPGAPVYLLHGATDNVIPALESRLLARHLEADTRVELLLTPLMVSFWAAVMDE
jgi:dienelactone hydrolase